MLRVKPPWSASVRLLDERDRDAVLAICDRDPVTNVFVSSRVRALGLDSGRLGAQLWGHTPGGRLESLCYFGANLVPVAATPEEVGVSPITGDGGASYRARLEQLIRGGRAFARSSGGRVIFKAEIGAVTPQACQVQGVWVRPDRRGQGLAAPGMAAVVAEALRS